jgi:hypothetical protein
MALRSWYRIAFCISPPRRILPSIMWWHTRMCISGVSFEQAVSEECNWRRDATARWYAGERM